MTYQQAISWLYSTQMFGIKLGLEGPTRLLREFLAFPNHGVKIVQVAGTNGKGSVCAMIDSSARACGWRTGLFTSPHLVDYRERMQISGEMISEQDCARYLTELRDISESLDPHPTFFEITLACAMRYFRDRACELIILETGMGGRLDATTAVPTDVSVITPIALDHTKWLGDTYAKIAQEKAGIMREGVPVFVSPQEPEALDALRKHANQTRTPFELVDEPLLNYPISLPGQHQKENAALAVAALHSLGAPLSYDSLFEGLSNAVHPGRFERVNEHLILDAAHNPHAVKSLVRTWKEEYKEQKTALIFGAVEDKDLSGVTELLAPLASEVHLVQVNSQRGLPTTELTKYFKEATEHESLQSALKATQERLTLLTGSLFLIGEAKALLSGKTHQETEQ